MTKGSKSATAKKAARSTRKNTGKSPTAVRSRRRRSAASNPSPVKSSGPTRRVRPSKKAAIIALLQQPNGAAIADLITATSWRVHSVRAALTGLRKEGRELVHAKDAAGITRYRLGAASA